MEVAASKRTGSSTSAPSFRQRQPEIRSLDEPPRSNDPRPVPPPASATGAKGVLADCGVALIHPEERPQIHGRIGRPVVGVSLQELPNLLPREDGGWPDLRLGFTPARIQLLKRHAPSPR